LVDELKYISLTELVNDEIYPLHRVKDSSEPFTDLNWLNNELLGTDNRIQLCAEYSQIFDTVYKQDAPEHQKEGNARYAANTWLREMFE